VLCVSHDKVRFQRMPSAGFAPRPHHSSLSLPRAGQLLFQSWVHAAHAEPKEGSEGDSTAGSTSQGVEPEGLL